MPYAINIRSDDPSSHRIRALWQSASAFEKWPTMESLAYPPHITVAIYPEIDVPTLSSALEEAFGGMRKLIIPFRRLGYFESPDAIVLWASPEIPEVFRTAVAKVHTRIGIDRCAPYYRPEAWVPHCSLALSAGLDRRDAAIAFANRPIESFEVVFDLADCVSFLPVKVLQECRLS